MSIYITGMGVSGYKSFGPDIQYLHPMTKINIFVGQNNCGKSNVLKLIEELSLSNKSGKQKGFITEDLTAHRGRRAAIFKLLLPLELEKNKLDATLLKLIPNNSPESENSRNQLGRLISALAQDKKEIWFSYEPRDFKLIYPSLDDVLDNRRRFKIGDQSLWNRVWTSLTGASGGGAGDWVPAVLNKIDPLQRLALPTVHLIPALRKIGEPGSGYNGFSGEGIIDKLAELERPNLENYHQKEQFEAINSFLQEVTENDTARLEIPNDKSTILVKIDGRTLPIQSLGTGIHEVIILAAAATTIENSIICLEEPELHLHPRLQKRLIKYLAEKTNNQYFISTHSAHLLDYPESSVFHLALKNGETNIVLMLHDQHRADICSDLGYKPSDLVQANAVIWVEGPSDRIYLKKMLEQKAPELKEGFEYSIMFYGGRLLSHLSANDPMIEDFISLRRLNRNIAILIDSDRAKASATINATKKRVSEEFNKGPGFAWITKGREFENYIEPSSLLRAIQSVHPACSKLVASNSLDRAYVYETKKGQIFDAIDKVQVARKACESDLELNQLDLSRQLDLLVSFIKTANHL